MASLFIWQAIWCVYSLNCIIFGLLIVRKNYYNCCQQISYFKAKMHQIRFRLRLWPRPSWGSSQQSPELIAGF